MKRCRGAPSSATLGGVRRLAFAALVAVALLATETFAAPRNVGKMLLTYYWIIDETNLRYRGPSSVSLRDVRGNVIARTTRRFRRDLRMEGSGRLKDGRVVTYMRDVAGEGRYRVTSASHGNGIGSCRLIPYRTIAVDPKIIALGSKVSIPALKGAVLPDGTTHDGIFMANDRAPFKGMHVDVFTAFGSHSTKPFSRKAKSRSRVEVFVVERPDRNGCHRR